MAGAAVYLVLRIGLNDQITLFIQVFMPLVMFATYFFFLGKAGKIVPSEQDDEEEKAALIGSKYRSEEGRKRWFEVKLFNREESQYWKSHVKYIPRLIKYMVPLFLVYAAEYMINQGLFELLYQRDSRLGKLNLNHGGQYRM